MAAQTPTPRAAPVTGDVPYFVVNPRSGNGATGRRWPRLEAEARAHFRDLAVGFTTEPMHAAELARNALNAGYRTIVAVGGDGTLNEVVNGFFGPGGQPVAPDAAVGILPQGTGGDFRRTAKVPASWSRAVRHIATAPVRRVDAGRVLFRAHDGTQKERFFLNVASVGVPGAVDEEVNRSSKLLGGQLSFMIASFRTLMRFRDPVVRFSIDGGPVEQMPITALAMGNGQYFGGGMRVAPGAILDDGLFHGTLWTGYTLLDFVVRAHTVYSGSHVSSPRTRVFTARKVTVESDERVLLDIDGEQPGTLPATFEILPGVINLRA